MPREIRLSVCILAILISLCHTYYVVGEEASSEVLSAEQLQQVDKSLERALDWLASQQEVSGSFPATDSGQPAITSLCVLAFMAQGHLPGEGKYGSLLELALKHVLDSQKKNGLIARMVPDTPTVPRSVIHNIGRTTVYNHAISSLMLSEVYAMSKGSDAKRIEEAIDQALIVTLAEQRRPKASAAEQGGWRYLHYHQGNSDLSVVGWYLFSLRSAKNAGFDVPEQAIQDAVGYVHRCVNPANGSFQYRIGETGSSRGMTGAGILALTLSGQHNTPEAQRAARWLLKRPFDNYNVNRNGLAVYHYSVFLCTHAMYQLGGEYWQEFFPGMVNTLLINQNSDGSWDFERHPNDVRWGNAFTTALVVLSLSAPNELLPIFQR